MILRSRDARTQGVGMEVWEQGSPLPVFLGDESQHSLRYKFRIRESHFTSVIIFTCQMGPVSVWGYGWPAIHSWWEFEEHCVCECVSVSLWVRSSASKGVDSPESTGGRNPYGTIRKRERLTQKFILSIINCLLSWTCCLQFLFLVLSSIKLHLFTIGDQNVLCLGLYTLLNNEESCYVLNWNYLWT